MSGIGSGKLAHRVEVVVPSFATLLSRSGCQSTGNDDPLFSSVFIDQQAEIGIFLGGPGSLGRLGFASLVPSTSDGNGRLMVRSAHARVDRVVVPTSARRLVSRYSYSHVATKTVTTGVFRT